jgi:hypothetical protein
MVVVREKDGPAASPECQKALCETRQDPYGVSMRMIVAAFLALLAGCSATGPVKPAATSKSGFDGAVYKGASATTLGRSTPGATQYRVFQQGASESSSLTSVRNEALRRAVDFCDREGKAMESVTETTSYPPYVPGDPPRVEIVFDCVDRASPPSIVLTQAEKDAEVARLKHLQDIGILTQAEFDREKAKVLGAP